MRFTLFGFLALMWALILLGGGIAVVVLGPISLPESSYESIFKGVLAILMVTVWIIILTKLKNWIFKKEVKF